MSKTVAERRAELAALEEAQQWTDFGRDLAMLAQLRSRRHSKARRMILRSLQRRLDRLEHPNDPTQWGESRKEVRTHGGGRVSTGR